jgi:SAM-dependent methyltransferase
MMEVRQYAKPPLPVPVCPDDLGCLDPTERGLSCRNCRRCFASIDGITELLPREVLCQASSESKQLNAYLRNFSERPDRVWKQPLRVVLHKMGNGYLHSWAARSLEQIGKGRALTVLDAGCGDGILKGCLSSRHTYVGVDSSVRPLLRARQYNPAAYFRADLGHLPFADHSFDVVVSLQALQYLVWPQAALAQMARILRPGGKLLLTVPNNESIKYRVEGISEIQLQRFDRKSVPALLAEHFEDAQAQPRGVWIPVPLVCLHAPGAYSPRWGLSWTIIGTPRK